MDSGPWRSLTGGRRGPAAPSADYEPVTRDRSRDTADSKAPSAAALDTSPSLMVNTPIYLTSLASNKNSSLTNRLPMLTTSSSM